MIRDKTVERRGGGRRGVDNLMLCTSKNMFFVLLPQLH
jgi:hypothetical protein